MPTWRPLWPPRPLRRTYPDCPDSTPARVVDGQLILPPHSRPIVGIHACPDCKFFRWSGELAGWARVDVVVDGEWQVTGVCWRRCGCVLQPRLRVAAGEVG